MPQKVTQVDESGKVINETNPLDVGGESFSVVADYLHRILEELKLHTELLKEIGK